MPPKLLQDLDLAEEPLGVHDVLKQVQHLFDSHSTSGRQMHSLGYLPVAAPADDFFNLVIFANAFPLLLLLENFVSLASLGLQRICWIDLIDLLLTIGKVSYAR